MFKIRLLGMMDGWIWLESEVGNGSTFYFVACFEKGINPGSSSGSLWCDSEMFGKRSQDCSDGNHRKGTNTTSTDMTRETHDIIDREKHDNEVLVHSKTNIVQIENDGLKKAAAEEITCRKDSSISTIDDIRSQSSGQTIRSNTSPSDCLQEEANSPCLLLKGMKVLLAEDNVVNQKVVCQQLKKFGTVVEVVSDGQQCLDALETSREKYDLILMDVQVKGNKKTSKAFMCKS